MASDMQKSAKSDNIHNNRNELGRWTRPRSRLQSRLDVHRGNREFHGRRREPRRPIFNGRNSTPRSSSIGGRGLFTRNSPRIRTMDTGPPPISMQPFRRPPPMNNSCHFTPNTSNSSFNSNRSHNRNNLSRNQMYSNTNQAFHPVHYQQQSQLYSESIPANHVQMPPHMRHNFPCAPSFFLHRRGYGGGFTNQHHSRRLSNRTWNFSQRLVSGNSSLTPDNSRINDRRRFSSYNRVSEGNRTRFITRRPFSRSRRGGRSGRGGRRGSDHPRYPFSRSTSQTKRYPRWKNNYRDLQRDIRFYFRLTPRDPLGLDDICRENRRRDNLGLTPLRGDSAMNTPAYSLNTPVPHREIEAPPPQPNCVTGPNMTPQSNGSIGLPCPIEPSQEANEQDMELELELESANSQLTASGEDSQRRESDSFERLIADVSGDCVLLDDNLSDSRREENEGLSREITPQSRASDTEAADRVATGVRVGDDPFHERHRNVVSVNARGTSRFAERTVTGNYHNYYTRRPATLSESTFRPYVESRRCLDIGCNNGAVTFKLAEMRPTSILGVDSDGRLIQEACRNLERARRAERERRRRDGISREGDQDNVLSNISFQTADYVPPFDTLYEPIYDTIIALSVTKWVHLVHGDCGIRRFLRRIYGELREGGHLIIEPQMLRSYRKSYLQGTHHDPDTQLHLRPPFDVELQELGFTAVGSAMDGRPCSPDFRQRNVYIYIKSAPEAMSTNPSDRDLYPRPPPCYYYPSPIYRSIISTQPSSSFNFPMTPVHASPTGSYLNETPGPSHALMHPIYEPSDSEDLYTPESPGYRESEENAEEREEEEQPSSTSASSSGDGQTVQDENSTRSPSSAEDSEDRSHDDFVPVPLNYIIPPSQFEAEETNSGAVSEASASAAQTDNPRMGRRSLKMKLKRLDHPNGSCWTIDADWNMLNVELGYMDPMDDGMVTGGESEEAEGHEEDEQEGKDQEAEEEEEDFAEEENQEAEGSSTSRNSFGNWDIDYQEFHDDDDEEEEEELSDFEDQDFH